MLNILHIISQLQFGKSDNLKIPIARRNAHQYAAALSTTLSNMNNEPKKYQAYLQEGFDLLKMNYSPIELYFCFRGHIAIKWRNYNKLPSFYQTFILWRKRFYMHWKISKTSSRNLESSNIVLNKA